MKLRYLTPLCAVLPFLALPGAQDPSERPERPERDVSKLTDEEKREIARQMQAAAVPGEIHEMLMAYAGDCTIEVTFAEGMMGQPMTIVGEGTREAVLGGRFLVSRTTADAGMFEVESLTILGYDRRTDEFTLNQYDSMGTYGIQARGPYDPETQTAKMSGTEWDPITQATQVYDIVLEFVDETTTTLRYIFHDEAHTKGGDPVEYMTVVVEKQG